MPLDPSGSPYFQDFDPTKGYNDILFKPSNAVQVRELNNLQATLQNQIKVMGDNLFQNGTQIEPGGITYNLAYSYVQLQALTDSQFASINPTSAQNVDQSVYLYSIATGLFAQVLQAIRTIGSNPDTIYVAYQNSGSPNGTTKVFNASEPLSLTSSGAAICSVGSGSNVTGLGSCATIQAGTYYCSPYFCYVAPQTIILDAYTNTPSYRVGLLFNDAFITYLDDPTLVDNAAGFYNANAPGADRYQIVLNLVAFPYTSTNVNNFIPLLTLQNGVLQTLNNKTNYNTIQKTIALQAYETNGNFTVQPCVLDVEEDLQSSETPNGVFTSTQGGDLSYLALGVEPFTCYVNGFRVQTIAKQWVPEQKARTTAQATNNLTLVDYGNFVILNDLFSFPSIDDLLPVNLYDTPIATNGVASGTQIGTAIVRGIEPYTGAAGPLYALYLFNIQMNVGVTIDQVKSIFVAVGTGGLVNCTANVITTAIIQNANLPFINGDVITNGTANAQVYTYNSTTGQAFLNPQTNGGAEQIIPAGSPITSTTSGTKTAVLSSIIVLNDPKDSILIFPLNQSVISTIRTASNTVGTSFNVRRTFRGTSSSSTVAFNCNTNEQFSPYTFTDYMCVVEDTGALVTLVLNSNLTFSNGQTTVTVTGLPSGTHHIKLLATIYKEIAQEKTKTLTTTTISATGPFTKSYISLGLPDIYDLTSVIETPVSGPPVDITSNFSLDDGQRDTFYDLGSIIFNPNVFTPPSSSTLAITFSYFAHAGNGDYFSVDSYTNFDGTPLWYEHIPTYASTATGLTYILRDAFDFRPVIDPNETTFTTTTEIVKPNSDVLASYQYYLPRIDKLYVDQYGNFNILQGVSSLTPQPPNDPTSGMVLYQISLNAYTFSNTDLVLTFIDNAGYTMADIGNLAQRISHLEYYTSLSLAEQQTANLQIIDTSTGLPRTQNGFIVDTFNGTGVGNTSSGDFKCSEDLQNGLCRPCYNSENLNLVFQPNSSTSYAYRVPIDSTYTYFTKPVNNLLTCRYNEVAYISQPYATTAININPYNVTAWNGTLRLTPATDEWKETNLAPSLISTASAAYDSIANGTNESTVIGTIWNEWQSNWTGSGQELSTTQVTNQSISLNVATARKKTTTGTTSTSTTSIVASPVTTVIPNIITQVTGTSVLSIAYVPYIRSRWVAFFAEGLKPSTQFYAFFDGVSVASYVKGQPIQTYQQAVSAATNSGQLAAPTAVYTGNIQLDDNDFSTAPVNLNDPEPNVTLGSALMSDGAGRLAGWFLIPPNGPSDTLEFLCGTRTFILTDNLLNGGNTTSSASASYTAYGVLQTDQQTITSTVPPPVQQQSNAPAGTQLDYGLFPINTTTGVESTYLSPIGQGILYTGQPLGNEVPLNTNPAGPSPNGWGYYNTTYSDPVAQAVLISNLPGGGFMSRVGIKFCTTDISLPVTVQVVSMSNGTPTQTVVPFTTVTLYPSSGSLPTTQSQVQANIAYGDVNAVIESQAIFQSPVYLQPDTEYAIVLQTNSNNYTVWTAEMGQTVINSNIIVSQLPYLGSFFESQNNSTWIPDPTVDLTFTLYRCKFDTQNPATLYFTNDVIPSNIIGSESFETSKNSNLLRIYDTNHGMPSGSYVTITLPESEATASYNGIAAIQVCPNLTPTTVGVTTYQISNVRLDSYMITLPVGVAATSSGLTGPSYFTATRNYGMDVLYPMVQTLTFPNTTMSFAIETTTSQSVDGSQTAYVKDGGFSSISPNTNIYMSAPKLIASAVNEAQFLANTITLNQKSFVMQSILATTVDNLSPVIDLSRISATLIANRLDNPITSVVNVNGFDNYAENTVTGTDISFSASDNSLNWSSSNFSNYQPYQWISITGGTNALTFPNLAQILSVNLTTKKMIIDTSDVTLINESAGTSITINLYTNYTSEEAPSDGTTASKYLTNTITLAAASDAIQTYLTAVRPPTSNLNVYYIIVPQYSPEAISNVPWTLMQMNAQSSTAYSANSSDYQDYVYEYDGGTGDNFITFVIKVVMTGTDTTQCPVIELFRGISLEQ